jgi:hypothetical protein
VFKIPSEAKTPLLPPKKAKAELLREKGVEG